MKYLINLQRTDHPFNSLGLDLVRMPGHYTAANNDYLLGGCKTMSNRNSRAVLSHKYFMIPESEIVQAPEGFMDENTKRPLRTTPAAAYIKFTFGNPVPSMEQLAEGKSKIIFFDETSDTLIHEIISGKDGSVYPGLIENSVSTLNDAGFKVNTFTSEDPESDNEVTLMLENIIGPRVISITVLSLSEVDVNLTAIDNVQTTLVDQYYKSNNSTYIAFGGDVRVEPNGTSYNNFTFSVSNHPLDVPMVNVGGFPFTANQLMDTSKETFLLPFNEFKCNHVIQDNVTTFTIMEAGSDLNFEILPIPNVTYIVNKDMFIKGTTTENGWLDVDGVRTKIVDVYGAEGDVAFKKAEVMVAPYNVIDLAKGTVNAVTLETVPGTKWGLWFNNYPYAAEPKMLNDMVADVGVRMADILDLSVDGADQNNITIRYKLTDAPAVITLVAVSDSEDPLVLGLDNLSYMQRMGNEYQIAVKPGTETSYFDPVSGERKSQLVTGTLTRESLDPDLTYDEDGTPTDVAAYTARVAGRKDLIVGSSVVKIADGTFKEWVDLDTVKTDAYEIGTSCFSDLNLSKVTIGAGTNTVGINAFSGNAHEAPVLEFEDGVVNILDNAFLNWGTGKEIILPSTLRSLGHSSFAGWVNCTLINTGGLRTIGVINDGLGAPVVVVPFGGAGIAGTGLSLILGDHLTSIGDDVFAHLINGTTFNVPASLVQLGARAFMGWARSTTPATLDLVFPTTTVSIGEAAFQNAHIRSVVFGLNPQLVVEKNGFFSTSLESLVVEQAEEFKDGAFGECYQLATINLGAGVTTLSGRVFSNSAIKDVVIPAGTVTVAGGIFANCQNIETITIAEGLRTVGSVENPNGFFSGSPSPLKEIVYPDSLREFYGDSFGAMGQLEHIYFGSNVTKLKAFGFNGGVVRGIYVTAPWTADMTYPSPAAPWCDVYVNDLAGVAANVDHAKLTNVAWTPIPTTASIPVLPDLVPLENSTADWSVQYRDLLTGEVKQLALGTEINVGDIPEDALIDEVLVNGTVITIKRGALAHRSIKRMKLMDGVKNVGGMLGAEYMKDLYIADTVNRIGGSIAIAASFEKFHMPTTDYLAIDATQFQTWNPELGFDLPTVSVPLPVAKDVVMSLNEVVGNVEQEGLSVMIKHGAATWGPVISGANGDFVYTSATDVFVDGFDYVIEATDVVGNESEYTFTYLN